MAVALVIMCATSVHAQDKAVTNKVATKEHACMMMSDSTSKALGLSAEQIVQVKESDARCMKACEKRAEGTTSAPGKMDQAAMTTHTGEMKKILTAEQFAKWDAMCNMSKAEKGVEHPKTY